MVIYSVHVRNQPNELATVVREMLLDRESPFSVEGVTARDEILIDNEQEPSFI